MWAFSSRPAVHFCTDAILPWAYPYRVPAEAWYLCATATAQKKHGATMVRFALAAIIALSCGLPSPLMADDAKQLIGSWRLKSFKLQIVGDEPTEPFGPDPKGSIVMTENRLIAIMTAWNRQPATNNEERAALLGSMSAYTGKYHVDGDRITTKVDTSWNEVYSGLNQYQVRIFKLEGDTLTLRVPEQDSDVRPGKRMTAELVWEREP